MNTANGYVKSLASGNKFSASFDINDMQYTFSGSLNPPVGDFSSNSTLEYSDVEQLNGSRDVSGKIGASHLTLTTANGSTISGQLKTPISSGSRVDGRGHWDLC